MIATLTTGRLTEPWAAEWGDFIRNCRAPRLRTMREFAEQEIIIPDGPFEGRRYSVQRQPYARLWFDCIDSRRWRRHVATGPVQSGKTLTCFVIPTLYHLFEIGETVICGLPKLEMARDKWEEDIYPVILRTRYRDFLPKHGGGSRGGKFESIRFRNGVTLKFMSGGGDDKSRAGFTSRVLVVTETDGMDTAAATSREADKIAQLEARTRAYGDRATVYMECTISTAEGRTWREYQAGTATKIVRPCPHCGAWVSPERQQLAGWQDAENEIQAKREAYFSCPECSAPWTEDERKAANSRAVVIHRGQSVESDGSISGEVAETDTLGFRWSAVDNLFVSAGTAGALEWKASRSSDEDNAEREMCQFVWATPPAPVAWQDTPLTHDGIIGRTHGWERGIVPKDAIVLTEAWDIHKWTIYWMTIAWFQDGRGHVVDYGKHKTEAAVLGTENAIFAAMEELSVRVDDGYPWEFHEDKRRADKIYVDSGFLPDVIYAFTAPRFDRYMPTKGLGAGQLKRAHYAKPKQVTSTILGVGDGWHMSLLQAKGIVLVEVDANHWKTWGHNRLAVPKGHPGAMTLFKANPREHLDLAKQLTSEKREETFVEGKGNVIQWVQSRSNNHWFDCYYGNCAAANFCGVELIQKPVVSEVAQAETAQFTTPDGRPFFVLDR